MSRCVLKTTQGVAHEFGSAVLRHVSSEGCQIHLVDARVRVGQRLRLRIEATRQITGTVRWSLGDRAGFEFDEPISAPALAAMARNPSEMLTVRLYLS